ncbi:MAG: DUF4870 domain-containing protein [Bdellovibrionales bacterium]
METYNKEEKNWLVGMHLSVLLGFSLFPLVGFLVPFVIWRVKRDESPWFELHGKEITNFMINVVVWQLIGGILSVIGIGILIIFLTYALGVILPVYAALKVSRFQDYKYPTPFRFL